MANSIKKNAKYFFVYRCLDRNMQNIYVGQHCSDIETVKQRINQHAKKSWFSECKAVYYCKCPSYDYMVNLERMIIEFANPKYNKEMLPYDAAFAPGEIEWKQYQLENDIIDNDRLADEWFNKYVGSVFNSVCIDQHLINQINTKKGLKKYKLSYDIFIKRVSNLYFGIDSVNCKINKKGELVFSFLPEKYSGDLILNDSINIDNNDIINMHEQIEDIYEGLINYKKYH